MRQEDALLVIVKWLRAGRPGRREDYSHYGYDLYLPSNANQSHEGANNIPHPDISSALAHYTPTKLAH